MHRKTAPAIIIADDHLIIRFGVNLILKKMYPNFTPYEASSYPEVKKILAEHSIQLLILDIDMPGGENIRSVSEFKQQYPDTKILIFTSYPEKIYSARYLTAGADAYLNKEASHDLLKETIRGLISGDVSFIAQPRFNNTSSTNQLDVLSDRELEVAKLLANGRGNLEISNMLDLKMSTVSTYKKRVFNKLDVDNLSELIKKILPFHNL
ncbi:response regulator transcription factor [Pedobacter xixiisoli]|uniref:Two component transcriptional regulator, LuxR family n=1 Tax=Pedobacter xixiisoli TaxID=1476464 RepID=A0A285ZUQ0_9SPHI|nr:response regulator transcription factor [Pedobacter xixiisoli]SOD13387.1 two component transcriptional regulator, LuxR family [Pedobacter xixiisoli]